MVITKSKTFPGLFLKQLNTFLSNRRPTFWGVGVGGGLIYCKQSTAYFVSCLQFCLIKFTLQISTHMSSSYATKSQLSTILKALWCTFRLLQLACTGFSLWETEKCCIAALLYFRTTIPSIMLKKDTLQKHWLLFKLST